VAQLGGYGAETRDEKAEREARERIYGATPRREPTSKTDSKEKR
jgi:hypothetical protein